MVTPSEPLENGTASIFLLYPNLMFLNLLMVKSEAIAGNCSASSEKIVFVKVISWFGTLVPVDTLLSVVKPICSVLPLSPQAFMAFMVKVLSPPSLFSPEFLKYLDHLRVS